MQKDSTPNERLKLARERAGYASATEAAEAMGVPVQTYLAHENGNGKLTRAGQRYAEFFKISLDWLMMNRGPIPSGIGDISVTRSGLKAPREVASHRRIDDSSNATFAGGVVLSERIPAYGQAMTGHDGRFVLNGQKVADVLAPPSLAGVSGAYAVFVSGTSMEPRYFAGECVFVHPRLPVRTGDFVVAQLAADAEGEPPIGFIKRFVSFDSNKLRLEQLNPKKTLDFAAGKVVSVHRIIMAGEGQM